MHAGYAYPDAAVVTITPSPTGDLTVSQQVDASYRRLIVYFDMEMIGSLLPRSRGVALW